MKGNIVARVRRLARRACLGLAMLAAAAATTAYGADYPQRPIRMVVPWVVGGSTDVLARVLAEAMSLRLGQSIVVENRPGAAGTIGTQTVVRSEADGYTILLGTNSTFAMAPHLYANLPYDHVKDLAPVGMVAVNQQILCVNPAVPANTVAEFLSYLRANPGKTMYASAGNGGSSHLAMELFMSMTGARMTHVPYKGGAPSLQSVLVKETSVAFVDVSVAVPQLSAGRLRALGTSGTVRSPLLPNVPTIAEAGVPGFESNTAFGLFVPHGTPPDRIKLLNKVLNDVMHDPVISKKLQDLGFEGGGGTPEEFGRYEQAESAKWGALIAQRHITIE
jgi:tripartite-type tricarboxylate transporter receptor subunit TctC